MKFILNEKFILEGIADNQVWYHGSPDKFNSFDPSLTGKVQDYGTLGTGCYFTDSFEQAIEYAKGGYVYTCKLHISNPLIVQTREEERELAKEMFKNTDDILGKYGDESPQLGRAVRDNIDSFTKGYDSIFAYWSKIPQIILHWNEACVKDGSNVEIVDVISLAEHPEYKELSPTELSDETDVEILS